MSKDYKVFTATMAVKSTKMSGACSLEKEREILSKLDGCPGVKQCYGEDVTLDGGCGLPEPLNILMATAGVLAATNHVAKIETSSDIRALGCVVLKMLTAKPPWILKTDRKKDPGSVTRDLLSMIGSTHESPAIPDNISKEGQDFLRYCYAKSPAWRSTASEVKRAEDYNLQRQSQMFLHFLLIFTVELHGNGRNLYILDALAEVEEQKCQELAAADNDPTKMSLQLFNKCRKS
ncbi:hypothetical protein POTOM_000333 [Populus tomentosa]|uniref:Protein kinase domain-containing protein n=1 Tax=Populus tomentosa TaxID=118781 RepID=A0A8X8AMV4_POPTO|nr:hypothetical protein POTOM_000333 [Populus tomentosa]